jgi:hypothetical protein
MKYSSIPIGKTYSSYVEQWKERLTTPMKGLSIEERKTLMHRKYNWDRAAHVDKFYSISPETHTTIANLPKQDWVVITEDWCLDSAFNLAAIAKLSALNEHISLRIIERDQHLDIMDNYLTNGGRAIPILIVFNEHGDELFHYGPRSKAAKTFREKLVEQGLNKNDISVQLLDFYLQKSWEPLEQELLDLLKAAYILTKN